MILVDIKQYNERIIPTITITTKMAIMEFSSLQSSKCNTPYVSFAVLHSISIQNCRTYFALFSLWYWSPQLFYKFIHKFIQYLISSTYFFNPLIICIMHQLQNNIYIKRCKFYETEGVIAKEVPHGKSSSRNPQANYIN